MLGGRLLTSFRNRPLVFYLSPLTSHFLFGRKREGLCAAHGLAAQVEAVIGRCGVGGLGGGVLHLIGATRCHARGGDEREGARERRLDAIGHQIFVVLVEQRVVAPGCVRHRARIERIPLLGTRDGAAAAAPASATALRGTAADGDARAGDLDVAVVVAVYPLFGCAARGVGQHGTVADGDGARAPGIGVDGIVAVGVADGHAAVEVDATA